VDSKGANYEQALQFIKDNLGGVCETYEICNHKACRDSVSAWFAAEAALSGRWDEFMQSWTADGTSLE
jgi:hypothetical protein